jgi:hypothetical protein
MFLRFRAAAGSDSKLVELSAEVLNVFFPLRRLLVSREAGWSSRLPASNSSEGLQLAGQLLSNNSGMERTTAISADVTSARTETPPVESGGA